MLERLFLLAIIVITLAPSAVIADKILKPEIAKGKAENCVAEKNFMRRNHMDLLQHDRDKTVHDGDRNIKHSLKQCINCHVVEAEDGKAVSASNSKHFCRSCHDYAAVSIDCFQCHNSKPKASDKVEIKQ